jgi:xanthine dehydrogenase YagS FAD-binding subunit
MSRPWTYERVDSETRAEQLLAGGGRALGGGTDLLTQLDRGIGDTETVVDLRGLGLDEIVVEDGRLRLGATARIADVARHAEVTAQFGLVAECAGSIGSQQLREMGTVAGNLCQQPRCWYFRHPDLRCWLRGGDTCYAQIGTASTASSRATASR